MNVIIRGYGCIKRTEKLILRSSAVLCPVDYY